MVKTSDAVSNPPKKRGIMTNADLIRNMTDEELAEILFDSCIENIDEGMCNFEGRDNCKKCVLKWLQAEVKEGAEHG